MSLVKKIAETVISVSKAEETPIHRIEKTIESNLKVMASAAGIS